MPGPRATVGGRVLLFDRLTDFSPEEPEVYPSILYDLDGLKDSVRRELEKLFSTRRNFTSAVLSGQQRTTISYGIPDAINLNPADSAGRRKLASEMVVAIKTFEPRLDLPEVHLKTLSERGDMLIAEISGHLVYGADREMVNFSISLDIKNPHG